MLSGSSAGSDTCTDTPGSCPATQTHTGEALQQFGGWEIARWTHCLLGHSHLKYIKVNLDVI